MISKIKIKLSISFYSNRKFKNKNTIKTTFLNMSQLHENKPVESKDIEWLTKLDWKY